MTAMLVNILLCVPGFEAQVRRVFYLSDYVGRAYCHLHFSDEKAEGQDEVT